MKGGDGVSILWEGAPAADPVCQLVLPSAIKMSGSHVLDKRACGRREFCEVYLEAYRSCHVCGSEYVETNTLMLKQRRYSKQLLDLWLRRPGAARRMRRRDALRQAYLKEVTGNILSRCIC